jgi:DNA-binding response OmpR family regulator
VPDAAAGVLLVEDDALLARIIQRYLVAHGHPTEVVGTAEEATDAISRRPPALVLIDINLPGDTGWSVLRLDSMTASDAPPAVIVSAGMVSPARLRELGAAGYLPKPFPLETLLATVQRFTAGRGALHELGRDA